MNTADRDAVIYRLIHPTTGQVLTECSVDRMPAEVLRVVQSIGQAPRIQIVDRQKTPV
ncbi:MAG TPA: hypothetical protein PLV03_02300 [Clostridiales bacterium]|nr:hypothetical protein [Clostridiales bacterium]